MSIVRLGPIRFGWCRLCNIPIVDTRYDCGLCGSKPQSVSVTPPGDVRPAFEYDIKLLRRIADEQFGEGCGESIFPDYKPVVLNRAPALDRMDEVVVDGHVLSTLKFEPERGYRLMLRMEGARRIMNKLTRNWIVVTGDAAPYIIKGASAMVPGIQDADPGIIKGDEVVVITEDREAIAVGFARMNGDEMVRLKKGAGTKTRHSSEQRKPDILPGEKSWDDVVKGNLGAMNDRIEESKEFIYDIIKQHSKPVAVSFSGGKDSLATLLLLLDAGIKPKMVFVDTGLEFDETVDNVQRTADEHGLELLVEHAAPTFWDNVWSFGPPSKDFRWCCKSCKLGPTTRLINKHFPDGVLSFIGQRRYESQLRAHKGKTWRNPWVPGQYAASPVQYWTALHVWLYIFMKKAEYNPWYTRGLERIGCYLCPSSDLAELNLVAQSHEEYGKWDEFLKAWASERGYPTDWLKYGLWRWKVPPKELRDRVTVKDFKGDTKALELSSVEGYSPCAEGLSAEAVFNTSLDIERIRNTANLLGLVEYEDDIKACRVDNIMIFGEGAVVLKGKDEKELCSKMEKLEHLVRKSLLCIGCGTCLGLCIENAIELVDGKSWIDEDLCSHCGKCISPCPAAEFKGEFKF